MRDLLKLMVVLLACSALIIGCGDKEEPEKKPKAPPKKPPAAKPKPAETDEAKVKVVALGMLKALEAGEADGFVENLDASDEDKAFLKQVVPPAAKVHAFVTTGTKVYGKKDWGAALAAQKLPPPDEFHTAAEVEKTLKVEIKDDKAIATYEGAKEPLDLVKKDGKWLAQPSKGMLPEKAEDRKGMLAAMKMMGDAMAKVQGQIKADVKPEKVVEALMKELAPPEPPAPPTPPPAP